MSPNGTVAVTDTGNKRVVLYTTVGGEVRVDFVGSEGSGPGQFVEPVGLAWLDADLLVVNDTGNRRLQVLRSDGEFVAEVALPEAWSDFYSRPQIAVVTPELWVVSDTPGQALWVVRDGTVDRVSLASEDIAPTGVAVSAGSLYVADLGGRIWVFDLKLDS